MRLIGVVIIAAIAIGLAGCQVSKPYVTKVDRIDQNVDGGNRGYLMGTPPPVQDRGELKRPFMNVDIDFPVISGEKTRETRVVKNGAADTRNETDADIRHETTAREEQVK